MDFENEENPAERASLFQSLDPIGNSTPKAEVNEEERKSMTQKLVTEQINTKLTEMLMRASNIFQQSQTILQSTSNRKDFDYLSLRVSDNKRFYKQVQKILHQYYEDNQLSVFSEIVQKYNPKLEVTEMIILVTSSAIYILDRRCNLKRRIEIKQLTEIILNKSNPCILGLSFNSVPPIILMSFRRSELIVYLLAQRESLDSFFPKP